MTASRPTARTCGGRRGTPRPPRWWRAGPARLPSTTTTAIAVTQARCVVTTPRVVWADTTHVGCGKATCDSGAVIWNCRYLLLGTGWARSPTVEEANQRDLVVQHGVADEEHALAALRPYASSSVPRRHSGDRRRGDGWRQSRRQRTWLRSGCEVCNALDVEIFAEKRERHQRSRHRRHRGRRGCRLRAVARREVSRIHGCLPGRFGVARGRDEGAPHGLPPRPPPSGVCRIRRGAWSSPGKPHEPRLGGAQWRWCQP